MSVDSSLLLGMTAALASSGVVSSRRCLGFSLDWGVSFCQEHSTKEHYGLLFYGALLAVEHKSFFLGHIEQVDDVCVVVSVILSVDEHIVMYGQYTRALGHYVIHPHLEDVLGHFQSKGNT